MVKSTDVDQAMSILNSKSEMDASDESLESNAPDWQSNHLEGEEWNEESRGPRPLQRMRSIMKLYIWFALGLNALFATFFIVYFVTSNLIVATILTALATAVFVREFKKSTSVPKN